MENEKPTSVHKALGILWSLLIIDFISSVFIQFNFTPQGSLPNKLFYYLSFLSIFVFKALVIFFLSKRKKWARWLYVIFLIFKIPLLIISLIKNIDQKSILGALDLIQIIAHLAVFIFLFSTPARAWFKISQDPEVRNVKKGKKKLLIILGLFLITLPFFGSFYLLVGVLSIQAIHSTFFDAKSVFHSDQIGKEVYLAPFTVLTKMDNYGGWRDEYNYIFANKPDRNELQRLNEYITFKVIDEKTQTSVLNSTDKICIIEDVKNKNLKASLDCENIPHINETTKIFSDLSNDIRINGKTYVATTADRRNSKLKRMLKINSFIVFEINNEEELKELIAPDDNQNESYEYIMRLSHLILLKEAEVFDEHMQSKVFISTFGGKWSDGIYGYSSFESYVQNNITPADMEKWIMENHSNPRDRWAIRSILSIVQQAIFFEQKMDAYRATEFLKGLDLSKECVAKYYSIPSNAKHDIEKALEKFFEKNDRKMAFDKIKNKFDSKYSGDHEICHQFFPPVVCGGEEKCESWTR